MKKILSTLIAAFTLFNIISMFSISAEETANTEQDTAASKVEISFCVGDETLIINGEEVTVENLIS